jgi:putative addiction module CopG family antidote
MGSRTVRLTAEQEAFVNGEIASGDYSSADEVVADSLSLLRREREMATAKTEILRQEIETGFDDWRNGRLTDASALDILRSILEEGEECGPG